MSESDQTAAEYAAAVSFTGDFNNDGYADLLIGVPKYDSDVSRGGAVFLFSGSDIGLSADPVWQVGSDFKGSRFGAAVSSAGDVNNDGYDDVLVGAYRHTNGDVESEEGRAYLFYGGPAGPAVTPNWSVESNQQDARLGYAVSVAGDVNGDGYDDVVVGAPGYGDTRSGAVLLYLGSETGLNVTADQIIHGNQPNALFGSVLATAGDVNGDGYADVIVGAPYWDGVDAEAGAAFLYIGSSGGLADDPAWQIIGAGERERLGTAVAAIGDSNQDGYGDVAIGAPGFDDNNPGAGVVYAYYGHTGGLTGFPMRTIRGGSDDAGFGSAISAADVNEDQLPDLIVGAPTYSHDQAMEGAAFIYLGAPGGPQTFPSVRVEGNKAETDFGRALAAGDANGDGCADLAVGAPLYRTETLIYGRALVYHGKAIISYNVYLPMVRAGP